MNVVTPPVTSQKWIGGSPGQYMIVVRVTACWGKCRVAQLEDQGTKFPKRVCTPAGDPAICVHGSASPLVWKEKPSPNAALNYVISWEAFYRYNYFKMPFLIRICQFMPTLLLIAQCLPSWLELTRNQVWETLMRSLKKHSHSEWIFKLFCKLFA